MTISLSRIRAARSTTRLPRISTMITVWQERRALGRMSANRLQDLGITRQDALREAARPFWDLPARKRRSSRC